MNKKDFLDELNKLIAPVTKGWVDFEIMRVDVDREGFAISSDDELCVDVRLILRKAPDAPVRS